MPGVSYALADFVTGGPIVDLPVLEGATWSSQLNRPDAVGCTVTLNDTDALGLDLRSASEPEKTVLLARTDDDNVVAWGVIDSRSWDDDARTVELSAAGIRSSYFGSTIIAPVSALTAPLMVAGAGGQVVNPALNTALSGLSLGSIGKRLVEARLAWPGAPSAPFILPPDEAGTRERNYLFSALKDIDSALDDLSNVENGPDFAFDAQRGPNGLSLLYVMRHGSEARPRIGTHAGVWNLADITGLKVTDDGTSIASASWGSAGKSAGSVLMSRRLNTALVAAGYPPRDLVDTSHNDVSVQATLDSYVAENLAYATGPDRSLSFTVRGDAKPGVGEFRPGDTVDIDVPADHPWLTGGFTVRVTSISGDETARDLKIGCVIVDG
jgi:hypothetical protein